MSERTFPISLRTWAAARAKVALDQAAGRESDPRVVAFANAKPAPRDGDDVGAEHGEVRVVIER